MDDPASTVPLERCVGRLATLRRLVQYAYQTQNVDDGPSWVASDTFAIEAAAENPFATKWEPLCQMVQILLADRFKLVSHTEQRSR